MALLIQLFLNLHRNPDCIHNSGRVSKTNFLPNSIMEAPDRTIQQLRVACIWYGNCSYLKCSDVCIYWACLVQCFKLVMGFLTFIYHSKLLQQGSFYVHIYGGNARRVLLCSDYVPLQYRTMYQRQHNTATTGNFSTLIDQFACCKIQF